MNKKYKLTEETKVYNGKTLHRIEALKDFGFEVSSFVESGKNPKSRKEIQTYRRKFLYRW